MLGLCYGGQVLADVLGGRIEAAPEAELGWYSIETDDADLVPAGPWLEWHYQRFTLPPGAHELARSSAGVQAFISGPHLGTQFHPESTIEIVKHWASSDRERLERLGVHDAESRLESGRDAGGTRPYKRLPPVRCLLAARPARREERSVTTGSLPASALGDSEPARDTDSSITSVRVLYPDLHGIARGKDVPIQQFDGVVEHGLCFCAAVMGTDLRHTPVVGGEAGYPDLIVRPDLSTMVTLPWEPGVACCLSNLEPAQADIADL